MTDDNKDILDIDVFTKLIRELKIPEILRVIRLHFYVAFIFLHNKKEGMHNTNAN